MILTRDSLGIMFVNEEQIGLLPSLHLGLDYQYHVHGGLTNPSMGRIVNPIGLVVHTHFGHSNKVLGIPWDCSPIGTELCTLTSQRGLTKWGNPK